ncbi:hypothetical protein F4604DRAFT_1931075 [Suillus subluteus]|nr:hypothetical protein F4604DRAFT_1931075 [Suillus subluteus]
MFSRSQQLPSRVARTTALVSGRHTTESPRNTIDEFLERYTSEMDIVLVFSGLFSAVSTTFIVAMAANLSPDPNDTSHALLVQLIQIELGNFTAAESTPTTPASTWAPSTTDIWIQTIAYASLSMSLLAAFGAVLGKQWLGCYRYGRGLQEEREAQTREVQQHHHVALRCCCAIVSGLTSDLPSFVWDRSQRQHVVQVMQHRLGHHCDNDLRIFILFTDDDGCFSISRLSISDTDIGDITHVAH